MQNLKPFDPDDIDETLTRVVTHGQNTYLMFPYIDATGLAPTFSSIDHVIDGTAATIDDFLSLSALLKQAGEDCRWFISFNTPWLMPPSEAAAIAERQLQSRGKRQ